MRGPYRRRGPPARRSVVPWFNRDEHDMVHKELFSGNTALQRHAMGRIAIWNSRAKNKLPMAIESTCQLISAQVTDVEAENYLGVPHEEVVLGYAMAVVRFVNLLTETAQNGPFARPIHDVAEEFDLPSWLVDLRHDATHGPMPSIQLLRSAACVALNCLKEKYWDVPWAKFSIKNYTEECGYVDLQRKADHSVAILVDYMQYQFQDTKEDEKEFEKLAGKLRDTLTNSREEFIRVFLTDGYLIPTQKQLLALDCTISETEAGLMFTVPKTFRNFWLPALNVVRKHSSPDFLAKHLIESLDDSNSLENKFRFAWTIYVIKQLKKESDDETSEMDEHVDRQTFRSILQTCLKYPNKHTKHIVSCLLPVQQPRLGNETKKKLLQLLDIYQKGKGSQPLEGQKPHTLDDILSLPDFPSEKLYHHGLSSEDWHNIPLGACAKVKITPTNLELPEYLNKFQDDPYIINISTRETSHEQTDLQEDMDTDTYEAFSTSNSWLCQDKMSTAVSIF